MTEVREGSPTPAGDQQMSAERSPDQGKSGVSPQESTVQLQHEEQVGLIGRSVKGLINILKDITSGRAHRTLNPTSPPNNVAPTEEPPSANTPTSQPSQS